MRSNTKILGQKKKCIPSAKAPTQGEVWGNGWMKKKDQNRTYYSSCLIPKPLAWTVEESWKDLTQKKRTTRTSGSKRKHITYTEEVLAPAAP